MKITSIAAYILSDPRNGKAHWVSHFKVPHANELLLILKTDEGIEGFGLATSYTKIDPLVDALTNGLTDFIVGADPLSPEQIYQNIFSTSWKRISFERGWSREAIIRLSAAVDIACWDIIGKKAGLPLYQLMGGWRHEVPYYVTCAYYQDGKDLGALREEMEWLKSHGHTRFKAKIGGLSLEQDIKRLETIR